MSYPLSRPTALLLTCLGLTSCVETRHATEPIGELRVTTREVSGSGITTRYFRGEKIFVEYSHSNALGRLYFHDDVCVISETDENRDGLIDTLTIFPEDIQRMEVFRRHAGGSIVPMESEKLLELRRKSVRAGRCFSFCRESNADETS